MTNYKANIRKTFVHLIFIWVLCVFIARHSSEGHLSLRASTLHLLILYTNDTQGLLHPCSCRDGVLGGLPRRATLLKSFRQPFLLLDSGNLLASDSDIERVPSIIKSYAFMGYQAVNVGQWDLRQQQRLTQEARQSNVPLLFGMDGVVARTIVVGSLQVGVIGLAPTVQGEDNKTNIETVVQQKVTELKAHCPLLVVLSQLGKAADEKLVEQVTGIDILIGNADWATLKAPLKVKDTFILPTSIKGQHLGRLEVNVDNAGKVEVLKHQMIPLTPDIPNDEAVYKLLVDYYRELAKRLAASRPAFFDSPLPSPPYMNAQACAVCHQKEYSLWLKSGHAHALNTLRNKGEELNPDCLTCHSEHDRRTTLPPLSALVGAASDKATLSPTVRLPDGVECSACHGDGREHSLRPRTKGLIAKAPDEKLCRQCHTSTQTPHFNYQKFVAKIKH